MSYLESTFGITFCATIPYKTWKTTASPKEFEKSGFVEQFLEWEMT